MIRRYWRLAVLLYGIGFAAGALITVLFFT